MTTESSGSRPSAIVRARALNAGERESAVALYRAAAGKTTSVPERNYLLMRAARLSEALR